jgi:carbonic anhydrase/acetyltransferase-like protein (isoleucine patch superfamily)
MIVEFEGKKPKISEGAFIFETAVIIGDVEVEEGASIWYGAVLRGDIGKIVVKRNANIQDNAVLHVDENGLCIIGENVTVGHNAIIHSANIGDNTLIGMGATILSNAKIGKNCIIGAQALVLENATFEDNSLIVGVPAKAVRKVSKEEEAHLVEHALDYKSLAGRYFKK